MSKKNRVAEGNGTTKKKPRGRCEELARLHQTLLDEAEEHRATIRREIKALAELDSEPGGDGADNAFRNEWRSLHQRTIEYKSKQLQQVETALERFRRKLNGVCEYCGKKIPLIRLRASHAATRCIACKKGEEQGIPSDPEEENVRKESDSVESENEEETPYDNPQETLRREALRQPQ